MLLSVACPALGVVGVKTEAAAGVVVAALFVLFASVLKGWTVLIVLSVAVLLGALVASAPRRRTGPRPDVTLRPGGEGRPWRRPR